MQTTSRTPPRPATALLGLVLLCGCHATPTPVRAALPMPDDEVADPPPEGLQGVTGELQSSIRSFYTDRGQTQNDEQWLLRGELDATWRWTDGWSAKARPRFLIDTLDHTFDRFLPLELYARYEADDWSVKFGQFIERWKMAGITHPIDVLNRRDLGIDVLNTERLGEIGARFSHDIPDAPGLRDSELSLYVMPVFQPSGLPSENSRFAPVSGTIDYDPDRDVEPSGPSQVKSVLRGTTTVDTSAVRGQVQLVAARGADDFPIITVVPGAGPNPEFLLVYYGATTTGLGFQLSPADPASPWMYTGEVVYKDVFAFPGSGVPDPDDYLRYVVGVRRRFAEALRDGDVLWTGLEYAQETGSNDRQSELRIFGSDVAWFCHWLWHDDVDTQFLFRGDHDVSIHETVVELRASRRLPSLADNVTGFARLQWFRLNRKRPSLFGLFPTNNSSLEVGATLRF